MRRYSSRIVGFKWSQKYPARYYPIFSYTDEDGNQMQYIRRKSLERTPFTLNQKYNICATNTMIYESTEKRLSQKVYLFLLRLIGYALSLIFRHQAVVIASIVVAIHMCYLCYKPYHKLMIRKATRNKTPADGRIVGYQKKIRYSLFGDPEEIYHPLIEYYYGNKLYTHTSMHTCEYEAYPLNQACPVYVFTNKKNIVDEFEIKEPIFKFKFVDLIAKLLHLSRNRELYTKTYKPLVKKTANTIDLGSTIEFTLHSQSTNQETVLLNN